MKGDDRKSCQGQMSCERIRVFQFYSTTHNTINRRYLDTQTRRDTETQRYKYTNTQDIVRKMKNDWRKSRKKFEFEWRIVFAGG